MNARPQIREKIIELKLRRWCRIALDPKYYPGCTAACARKNFWRLCKAHPDVMRRSGYSELSVYP